MTHLDPFLPSHPAAALIELYEAFGDPDHFEKGKELLNEVLALKESDNRWTFEATFMVGGDGGTGNSGDAILNSGKDDELARVGPLLERLGDWRAFLGDGLSEEEADVFWRHERTGRPLGSEEFVARLEKRLGRVLQCQKPGPKGPRKEQEGRN